MRCACPPEPWTRISVAATAPLVVGIVWAMGVVGLTLGTLNLMTSMMMVVLLGLGIDFSVHIANRFQEELEAGRPVDQALLLSLSETGLGVITGAVTTALAFLALMIADTKGVSEFGFCAGTGVLATLAAVLWLLPALLAWRAERSAKATTHPDRFAILGRTAVAMGRWRWPVLGAGLAITLAGGWAGTRLGWEWDFMELEPKGLRSVALQDELIDRFHFSVQEAWLIASSPEEARQLRQDLEERKVVGEVDDISTWVSRPDVDRSLHQAQRLRMALSEERTPEEGASVGLLAEELDRLWANLVEIQAMAFTGGQDRAVEATQRLVATREHREEGRLRRLADRLAQGEVSEGALEDLGAAFSASLESRARQVASARSAVTPEDVPPAYLDMYRGEGESGWLMRIFPRENVWWGEELRRFQDSVTAVDARVTGTPLMILEMNEATKAEGSLAFLAALGVILGVLLLDFRRPLVALLSFLPLVLGLGAALGAMWVFGLKLHYINIIALPVILGIGVDDGVHFFHRFLQEGRGGLKRAVTGVGRAMLMSSLTTMVGFGSLMAYSMRGMAHLGFVLFVGVGFCLVASFTVLPALAVIFEDRLTRGGRPSAARRAVGLAAVALLALSPSVARAAEPTAAEILALSDQAEAYSSSYAEVEQVITTSSGRERTLVTRTWAVDTGDKQLAEYLSPPDVAGQKILMTGGGDDTWMYNPETVRTRKLGSHMKKKKVMGSDFTYEDQSGGSMAEKYTGELVDSELLAGVDCWVLALRPTPEGPSYSQVKVWIAKSDHLMRRVDFWREGDSAPYKRLSVDEVRSVDGRPMPWVITMTTLEDDSSTLMRMRSLQLDVDIPASFFEARTLGQ